MIKAQGDGEEYQYAEDLGSGIKTMDPGIFIEIEKNVHIILSFEI